MASKEVIAARISMKVQEIMIRQFCLNRLPMEVITEIDQAVYYELIKEDD